MDDHREALREKEGKIDELFREVKKLNAAGEAATAQISWLRADLDREAVVHSSHEKKLERLGGELEKKGSEVQERVS